MGGKFKQRKNLLTNNKPSSRKDMRKKMRKEKKAKKNEYFKNKKKVAMTQNFVADRSKNKNNGNVKKKELLETLVADINDNNRKVINKPEKIFVDEQSKLHKQEIREKAKLERGMVNKRKKMLLEANKEEDREIKKLEKQLKLNKRKSKTLPKSFVEEGLGWVLEVCDTDKSHESNKVELTLEESGSEFEEDFALVTGKGKRKPKEKDQSSKKLKKSPPLNNSTIDEGSSDNESLSISSQEDEDLNVESEEDFSDHNEDNNYNVNKNSENFDVNDECGSEDNGNNYEEDNQVESEIGASNESCSENESNLEDSEGDYLKDSEEDIEDIYDGEEDGFNEDSDFNCDKENSSRPIKKKQENGQWEDIYGRLRDTKGNVVQTQEKGKYIPPQLRAKQLGQDSKNAEELARLKKQLKGLVNRLAESNMHSIANQIDELYMRNSRNDMNDSLLSLISEALIAHVLTPERLVTEHAALITVLHANVGLEVGAHFLQNFVQRFDTLFKQAPDVEDKELDNVLLVISHMYNFKMFHSVLMYNILDQLVARFTEKEVELILLVLRSVGFGLRKDDPLALKDLVLRLQKKANESTHLKDNPRVRFMLDILLAVKNNNVAKIPQYDPSYTEHLKKLVKTMIHKGKYVTELKITLEDLLKAEERGRWWIVGSAWSGTQTNPSIHPPATVSTSGSQYSQAVLDLARKQRMNTDTRRNIFCILVTAEDYLDAFEKLLRLGLKAQQEQEIIHVMMHCLLQEKSYNPYYTHLATHFCKTDRKHQMTIQYHLWDKLKELSKMSKSQITNLAKLLAHLFLEKALPISVLKVMQFSEMDKWCVRLLRQVLLSVLLSDSVETVVAVFARVSRPEKLHMFRESLRLFLHHFILRNAADLPPDQATTLQERVKLAETALITDDNRAKFL